MITFVYFCAYYGAIVATMAWFAVIRPARDRAGRDPMSGDQAAEARPVTVNDTSHASQIEASHVWTEAEGDTHGTLDFGASWIVFHDPQQVREAAAKLSAMADAMDAEIARVKAGGAR